MYRNNYNVIPAAGMTLCRYDVVSEMRSLGVYWGWLSCPTTVWVRHYEEPKLCPTGKRPGKSGFPGSGYRFIKSRSCSGQLPGRGPILEGNREGTVCSVRTETQKDRYPLSGNLIVWIEKWRGRKRTGTSKELTGMPNCAVKYRTEESVIDSSCFVTCIGCLEGQLPVAKKIGELLLQEGLIDLEQLNKALEEQQHTGERIGTVLIKLGFITEEVLVEFIARQFNLPQVNIARLTVSRDTIGLIPPDIAQRYQAVPFGLIGNTLNVAMADPGNLFVIDDMRFLTRRNIQVHVASEFNVLPIKPKGTAWYL